MGVYARKMENLPQNVRRARILHSVLFLRPFKIFCLDAPDFVEPGHARARIYIEMPARAEIMHGSYVLRWVRV